MGQFLVIPNRGKRDYK